MATDLMARPAVSRLVSAKGMRKLLAGLCLPMYAGPEDEYRFKPTLASRLQGYRIRGQIYCWWRKYFHEAPPLQEWLLDLQFVFIHRVSDDLFPIDGTEMDGLFNSGAFEEAEPLDFPIQYLSHGVPWEMEAINEFLQHTQPLIQIDDQDLRKATCQWWENECGLMPHCEYIMHDFQLAQLRDALACQESPLDGLAVALDCVRKRTGNVFIDAPAWFRLEYEPYGGGTWYDEYFWCDRDVDALAADYARAKDDVARLEAYEKWFDATPDATTRVCHLLVDLVDREWYIENGKVVFTDDGTDDSD